MSQATVRNLLLGRLSSLSPAWPIAWENVKYQPILGTKFIQQNILFGQSTPSGPGTYAAEKLIGSLVLSPTISTNSSTKDADIMADAIKEHFYRGLVLFSGSIRVQCSQGYVSSPQFSDEWYRLPVWIPFYSYIF